MINYGKDWLDSLTRSLDPLRNAGRGKSRGECSRTLSFAEFDLDWAGMENRRPLCAGSSTWTFPTDPCPGDTPRIVLWAERDVK